MLSFIKEKKDLWQYLCGVNKPIVLYGMGDGADKILRQLAKCGLQAVGVFASDERVRGQKFHDFTVKKYEDFKEELGEFIVLVSFGTHLAPVMENIKRIAEETELYVPDVPVAGEEIFDLAYLETNRDSIEYSYAIWEDDASRQVFSDLINFKLSGKIEYLDYPHELGDEAPWELTDYETYVDVGAYSGDTILSFLKETEFRYQKIYALEPDSYSFGKLQRQVEILELDRVVCLNVAAWDKTTQLTFQAKHGRGSTVGEGRVINADSIDNILDGESATLIKIDAEGSEEQVLRGAYETMDVDQPKMIVAAYHRSNDLFVLPSLLIELNPSYRLYLRKTPAYPCWEVNIYAK